MLNHFGEMIATSVPSQSEKQTNEINSRTNQPLCEQMIS